MEIVSGTLHLALNGRSRIVVCSDSRGHSDTGPVTEEFQKLFKAGKRTACGISGVLMLTREMHSATRVAALCAEDRLQDSPRDLLCAIRDDMHGWLTGLFAENPLPDTPSAFAAFAIRRQRKGEIDLLELDFPIVGPPKSSSRSIGTPEIKTHFENLLPRGPFAYHHSHGDCLPVNWEKMVVNPDSPDVLASVDNIFEAVRLSSPSCRDEVGGSIDVAAIDSEGFRWLRRKPIPL